MTERTLVDPVSVPALSVSRTAAVARRRSSRLTVLAVLVVLLGGVIALFAGQGLTKHSQVLAVVRAVQVGSRISADDLAVANVTTDPRLSPVPASEEPQVVGLIAEVSLAPGELLTRAEIGAGTGFTAGEVLVALPLKPGQFPERGLTPGQRVLVVPTSGSAGIGSPAVADGNAAQPAASPAAGVSAPPQAVGVEATVAEVGAADAASQLTVVDVRVASGQGAGLADLASTGNLALILLPAGG